MENALLELKGKLKMLYASYGSYLLVLFKFLLAFLVFEEINRLLPYVEGLDQIFVVLLASLICSIMPWNLMVFLGMGLIVGQCYGIGIEIAGLHWRCRDYGDSVSALYTPGCVGITFDTGSIFFWCAVSDPYRLRPDQNTFVCNKCRLWCDFILFYGTCF